MYKCQSVYAYTHKPFPKVLMCYVLEGRKGLSLSSDHYQFVQRHRTHTDHPCCIVWLDLQNSPFCGPLSLFHVSQSVCDQRFKIPMPFTKKRGPTRAGQSREESL